jgi:hypothetical protein
MPWSSELEDPVKGMLMRYGEPVYRGPRSPVAGVPRAEIPDDLLREWEEELGLQRQRLLGPLATRLALQGNDLEKMGPERARAVVRKLDNMAAKFATLAVSARHNPQPKPFRRETLQEMTGPAYLQNDYRQAAAAREQAIKEAQEESP